MTTLTADDGLVALLRQTNDLAEIRDASGMVIGFFAPVSVERAHLCAQAAARRKPRADREELDRRAREKGEGYTTKEVFQHLQTLTENEQTRAYLQEKINRLEERDGCDTP